MTSIGRRVVLLIAAGIAGAGCHGDGVATDYRRSSSLERGAVACVDPVAADVGGGVLRRGGNAVDAAVATALALAVTWPAAGNLGGGGFLLLHRASGEDVFLDFRETAPAGATETMYLDDAGRIDEHRASDGALAVGVPGSVRGLDEARRRYGTMPWRELVAPACALARDGFIVRRSLARSLANARDRLAAFPDSAAVYLHADGTPPREGDTLRLPSLARTLDTLARDGADAFYRGPLASAIVLATRRAGGCLSETDLDAYAPNWRVPVRGTYRGFHVVGAPLPSSGGTVVLETLNLLEGFDLRTWGRDDARTVHTMVEAMRLAYRDRARWLGDPDRGAAPPFDLTSKRYAEELRRGIRLDRATPSLDIAEGLDVVSEPEESHETTHLTVCDASGNVVSLTTTLNDSFGSAFVAGDTGVLLNNEMSDFDLKPGFTSTRGPIGTPPNRIAPGKRMLSSMAPTLVFGTDGREVVLALGSPGGRTIPNTVIEVIVNVVDFEMTPREAVDHGRFHHQWLPDRIVLEPHYLDEATREQLRGRGHVLRDGDGPQGDVHALARVGGRLVGVADSRIDGATAAP
ncbi:MAG: gamma-glutamyltransferase [Planctomycetes bacterium]|nr:gamma-glutamyltransferase [Planctomycetota bacterium]